MRASRTRSHGRASQIQSLSRVLKTKRSRQVRSSWSGSLQQSYMYAVSRGMMLRSSYLHLGMPENKSAKCTKASLSSSIVSEVVKKNSASLVLITTQSSNRPCVFWRGGACVLSDGGRRRCRAKRFRFPEVLLQPKNSGKGTSGIHDILS